MIVSVLWNRIAAAAVVAPTAQGATAFAQAVGVMGLCTGCVVKLGLTDRFIQRDYYCMEHPNIAATIPKTFMRALFTPGLMEEVIWRVLFQPPGMHWGAIVAVNAAFAAYHVFGSAFLAERLDNRLGARAVFRDPTFLFLAFILGNACSYAYVQAGYALWAPVLAHTIPVTIWLTLLGGDKALSTPGGLCLTAQNEGQTTPSAGDEGSNHIPAERRNAKD